MVWEVGVLKSRGLLDIYQFIQGTIKECTFYIHLLQFKVMMCRISKKDTDGLKASHGCICLSIINAFNLRELLCNQSCLVTHNNSMAILLVFEYPLGTNNIVAIFGLFN